MTALETLINAKPDGVADKGLQRNRFVKAKMRELSNGTDLEKIISSPGLESLLIRKEMNHQLPINRVPVEILGMVFKEYWNDLWEPTLPEETYPVFSMNKPNGFLRLSNIAHVYVNFC